MGEAVDGLKAKPVSGEPAELESKPTQRAAAQAQSSPLTECLDGHRGRSRINEIPKRKGARVHPRINSDGVATTVRTIDV